MPELPEVETITRCLREGTGAGALPGAVIHDVMVLWDKVVEQPGVEGFIHKLQGEVVISVSRRGKFVVVGLQQNVLLIHLRMSGDLRLEQGKASDGMSLPLQKHDRFALHFMDGRRMVFNDPRKFGRAWLVKDSEEVTGKLGPEPLEDSLTASVFFDHLHAHRRQIKPLLMDQSFLAGMGNIYTDEALHLAKIHPLKTADTLSVSQAADLLQAIRTVLQEGIRRNGASIDWVYRGGDFQNVFNVYQRNGETCRTCGTVIQRIVVGQRGTHFCPHCQGEC